MPNEEPILTVKEATLLLKIAQQVNPGNSIWLSDGVCLICQESIFKLKDFKSGLAIRLHGRMHLRKLAAFV